MTLIDDPVIRATLRRIVARLEANADRQKDLLQEALVHLWSEEQRYPGQRLSWYLQSWKFQLLHLHISGKSLDSPKHSCAQVPFPDKYAGNEDWPSTLEFDEGIMSEVNAHDVLSLLLSRLEPLEGAVLCRLAEGLGSCEIGQELGISHQAVLRRRQTIAKAATQLGITRPLGL